jgi:hypothetical protein
VTDETKEITKNWFFKISSITELIPRFYIEAALLRCYQFISPNNSFASILARLASSVRGVGDPLVASYCRAYLVICSTGITTPVNGPVDPVCYTLADDFLVTFKELNGRGLEKFKPKEMKGEDYFKYFSPSVHWILNFIARSGSREVFKRTMQGYKKYCNHSMVLLHILETFKSDLYADNVLQIVELVKESEGDTVPKVTLYAAMGAGLIKVNPSFEFSVNSFHSTSIITSIPLLRITDYHSLMRCGNTCELYLS